MNTLMDEVNGLMKIIICRLFGPTRPTQIALPRVSGYIEQSFRHSSWVIQPEAIKHKDQRVVVFGRKNSQHGYMNVHL